MHSVLEAERAFDMPGVADWSPASDLNATWHRTDTYLPNLEEEAKRKAALTAGSLALHETVELDPLPPEAEILPAMTMYDALTILDRYGAETEEGKRALAMIDTNIKTDLIERFYKVGRSRVELEADMRGLVQHGIPLEEISKNTLKYTALNATMMDRVVHGELKNVYLFNALIKNGLLKTHDAVVFSLAPKDAKTKDEYNFFADTDSASIQVLSHTVGNKYALDSALVAGKRNPNAKRHDLRALKILAKRHNVEFSEDEDGSIRVVILTPKGLGVDAIVEEYDDIVGGTFYGQDAPKQDYKAFAEERLSLSFDELVDEVRCNLLSELPRMRTHEDAVLRLNFWSGKVGVAHAASDYSINPKVFGQEAAYHIEAARFHFSMGNYEQAQQSIGMAKRTEKSGSCPLKTGQGGGDFDSIDDILGSGDSPESNESKGDVEMTCPFCREKTKGDPCSKKGIQCTNCKSHSRDSESLNKKRAARYHANKLKSSEVKDHEWRVVIGKIIEDTFFSGDVKGDPKKASSN